MKTYNILLFCINQPLHYAIYDDDVLVSARTIDEKPSSALAIAFQEIEAFCENRRKNERAQKNSDKSATQERAKIGAIYYAAGPGNLSALRLTHVFLHSLAIIKGIKLYAADSFAFLPNSYIYAFGKRYFYKADSMDSMDSARESRASESKSTESKSTESKSTESNLPHFSADSSVGFLPNSRAPESKAQKSKTIESKKADSRAQEFKNVDSSNAHDTDSANCKDSGVSPKPSAPKSKNADSKSADSNNAHDTDSSDSPKPHTKALSPDTTHGITCVLLDTPPEIAPFTAPQILPKEHFTLPCEPLYILPPL
ncbi:hypothetical protein BKN38_06000 [Helicobacter sp. CLO-3]|uniref:hypothetical protein n=1 Tax=unclassified Helicobacter TaxID=2593540 RepID=UPI00080590A4|nr:MULTISPECIES: hypothetical protein [unclassified Helicobacter]OBV29479.1 hypothetical protein BA723_05370 [Helicobacter sp. CLO-3]OHU83087.1 hypothetical protein BKN38_06000 [Helicobacter sp. CLO-3]